jgi:hypothetical protein
MKSEIFKVGVVAVLLMPASSQALDRYYSAPQPGFRQFQEQLFSELARMVSLQKTDAACVDREKAAIIDSQALILPGDRDPLDVILRRTRALIDNEKRLRLSTAAECRHRLEVLKNSAGFPGLAKSGDAGLESLRKTLFSEVCNLHRIDAFSAAMDFDTLLLIGWHRSYWEECWLAGENCMLDQ